MSRRLGFQIGSRCKNAVVAAVLMAGLSVASAEVKLANMFSDNMVLQRDMPVPVWGTADPGEKISVSFVPSAGSGHAGQKKTAVADKDGSWQVHLDPMKASDKPSALIISSPISNFQFQLSNLLVGDIWLCSGQSNMAFQLQKDRQAESEIPRAANPNIRFLLTAWQSSDSPLRSVKAPGRDQVPVWVQATPETVGNLTAVGYWFAKNIEQSIDVPVGLITAYKGGSPVEAWLSKDALLASGGGAEVWARYEEACEVFPEKQAVYEEEMKEWREKVKGLSLEARNKVKRPRPPYGPTDGNHPCGLYYGSIAPYQPMAIRGVLWYQAESNACSPMRKAVNYESVFTNLIRSWRTAWGREDLPFLFVQLPPFRAMSPEPEDSVWSRVRDAQTRTLALQHTGMAIILDAGNERDIHPKDKQPAGDRLAQWAKGTLYGIDVVPSGPLYESMEIRGNTVVITFKHAGGGLEARDVSLIGGHELSRDKLQGFSICGADSRFVWADAEITAPNKVTVSSVEVPVPVAVRYAWSSFPLCNLYNKDGLPASAFRTDSLAP